MREILGVILPAGGWRLDIIRYGLESGNISSQAVRHSPDLLEQGRVALATCPCPHFRLDSLLAFLKLLCFSLTEDPFCAVCRQPSKTNSQGPQTTV